MTEKRFRQLVKHMITTYVNTCLDATDGKQITDDDVYIVWQCKVLQNNKALASTTLPDGMYYEITYNGDKREMCLEAYKKWATQTISLQGE